MANDLITGYVHRTWEKGNVLTADGLNNIENGLWGIIARFKGESTDSSTFDPSQQIAIKNDIEVLDMTSTGNSLKTISTLNQVDGLVEVTYQDIQKADSSSDLFGVIKAGTNLSANEGILTIIDSPAFNGTLTVRNLNIGTNSDNTHYTIGSFTNDGINFYKNLSITGSLELTGDSNTLLAGSTILSSLNIGTNNDNTHYTIGSFTNNGINFYKNLSITGSLNLTGNSNTLTAGTTTLSSLNIGTGTEENGTTIYSIASLNNDNIKLYKPTSINNTLGVTGATTVSNTLSVTGATTIGNTLSVTGATTVSSTLNVTGMVTVDTFNASAATLNSLDIQTINENLIDSIGSFNSQSITLYKPSTILDQLDVVGNVISQGFYSLVSVETDPMISTGQEDEISVMEESSYILNEEETTIRRLDIRGNEFLKGSLTTKEIILRDSNDQNSITLNYSTLSDLIALLNSNQPSGGD